MTFDVPSEPGAEPPPDPSEVAPALPSTVQPSLSEQLAFLYTGADPIQTGVSSGVIVDDRASLVRGRVMRKDGLPEPMVEVSVVGHPEFGQTLTREDGWFDLVVNGGQDLVLAFEKEERISVQRRARTRWQEAVTLEDVVIIGRDPTVTVIDFSDPIQVAQSSPVLDVEGWREATLLFTDDVEATMHAPGSSPAVLPTLSVRATEFTVGANGPNAMPAELPGNTAYTYAVDFSIDEAVAANATSVTFDPPVLSYSRDILRDVADAYVLAPGDPVPAGYYDSALGHWVPEENGLVVRLIDVSGTVGVDITDNATNDLANSTQLAALGITAAEIDVLETLYPLGTQLWRTSISHFSGWDLNFGNAPPPGATDPPAGPPPPDLDNPCRAAGSVIECENQVLGESVPLSGVGFDLHYRSSRAIGGPAYRIMIPTTGATVHPDVLRVVVESDVAGRHFSTTYEDPGANEFHELVWDGLDPYGRFLQGPQALNACVGHVYQARMWRMDGDGSGPYAKTFGYNGNGHIITAQRGGNEITLWSCQRRGLVAAGLDADGVSKADYLTLGTMTAANGSDALGGWTVGIHHAYSPSSGILYMGDGTMRHEMPPVVRSYAGTGSASGSVTGVVRTAASIREPRSLALTPEGDLLVLTGSSVGSRLLRIPRDPAANVQLVAGTGAAGFGGDGGAATSAQISASGVSLASDGTIYLADISNRRVRRIATNGVISTVAGNGSALTDPDDLDYEIGGLATGVPLGFVHDVEVDREGVVYFSHGGGSGTRRINAIERDGTLRYVAGYPFADWITQSPFEAGTLPVHQTLLRTPTRLAMDHNGELMVMELDTGSRIQRLGGKSEVLVPGVGGYALAGKPNGGAIFYPSQVDVGTAPAEVTAACSDPPNCPVLFQRSAGGRYEPIAGGGTATSPDGVGARDFAFGFVRDVVVGHDGAVYIADSARNRIYKLATPAPSAGTGSYAIASKDGAQIYDFDEDGRHLSTRDAMTDATVWAFGYDTEGRLATITDQDGRDTTIVRNGSGVATAIEGPDGVETTLGYDANGYLATVTNAEAETYGLTTQSDGLLTVFETPANEVSTFTYVNGRLQLDEDPEGGSQELLRTIADSSVEVTRTTAMGREHVHAAEVENGELTQSYTAPDGTSQSVRRRDGNAAEMTLADGTQVTYTQAADPRFGWQAPVPAMTNETTPVGGLERRVYVQREVGAGGVLTERSAINDAAFTTAFVTSYDPATRTLVATSPEGRETTLVFDTAGRVASLSPAGLTTITFDRLTNGKMDEVTAGIGAAQRRTLYSYDTGGFSSGMEAFLDSIGLSTAWVNDAVGRPTSVTLPDAQVVGLGYDDRGRVTGVTPPGQPEHALEYNGVGQLSSYTPPTVTGGGPTEWIYNLDHQLTEVIRPDALGLVLAHDAVTGQLEEIEMSGSREIDIAYDTMTGKVSSFAGPDSTTVTYQYDGRLLTSEAWSGGVVGTVVSAYNDEFERTSITAAGSSISMSYDDDGLLMSAGALTVSRENATGLLATTTVGSIDSEHDYNEFGEPTLLRYTHGSTVLFEEVMLRDDFGQIYEITETIEAGTPVVLEFDYDDQSRLEVAYRDSVVVSDHAYDGNGNMTSRTSPDGTVTATYDDQDRMTARGSATYAYNAFGDLEQRSEGSTTMDYDYDELGHLRAVSSENATIVEYEEDARGRRVVRDDGANVSKYLYDGQLRIVAELSASNTLFTRFVYGTRGHSPDYMVRAGVTYRFVADHLGSVRLVVNASTGAVVQRIDYDVWGRITSDTSPGFQPFGFAGGLYDPATGLVRFGARDYDPSSSRWQSKDPAMFGGGLNFFAYVANDPVNFVDPDGRDPSLPQPNTPILPKPLPGPGGGGGGAGGGAGAGGLLGAFLRFGGGFGLGFCLGCPACCGFADWPDPDNSCPQEQPRTGCGIDSSCADDPVPSPEPDPDDEDYKYCLRLYESCQNHGWRGPCDDCFWYCKTQGEWPFDDSYGFWCA